MRYCMGCMAQIGDEFDVCPHCGYVRGTPPREAYHMPPETILAERYIVGRVLGYGGFGVTYIGWDARLERKVAIKEFLPAMFATRLPGETTITVYTGESTAQFRAGLERFTDEAQRLAKFNGIPGIVDIYDTCVENNTAYIIMEFLQGQDVKELLNASGPLPYERAKEIVLAVCDTLEPVHAQGIIHRDISPDNIYITADGQIKLLDFGAARYETSRNSKSLSVILKAGYAPEEQYRSHGEQGPWTDVYALAATMYKMITGVTPDDSMERAVRDELKEPSALGAELPPSAENALMNALNVRAENRTRTVADLKAALTADDVQRVKERQKGSDSGGMPLWGKLLIGGAAALLVVFALLTATGVLDFGEGGMLADTFGSAVPEGFVNAPGVVNRSQDEAEQILADSQLQYRVTGREFSDRVEKHRVLAQEPQAGRLIEMGGTVDVTICGGPEEALADGETPDVLFEEAAIAEEQLEKAQDTVIVRQYLYTSQVAEGLVIDQQETALEDGTKQITLTISLGEYVIGEDGRAGVPYLEARVEDDTVMLYAVLAQKTEDSFQIYHETSLTGRDDDWTIIPSWNPMQYGAVLYSDVPVDQPQPLTKIDLLMSLARGQSIPSGEPFYVRAAESHSDYGDQPHGRVADKRVAIFNDPAGYPAASVTGVEEVSWEEVDEASFRQGYGDFGVDGWYLYRISGDFVAGRGYYLFDGAAAMDENRRVVSGRDGELIVATAKAFDGSSTLARFMPLYGAGEDEEGTLWMKVGQVTVVDGKDMVLSGEVGDVTGLPLLDAIEAIAGAAGRYGGRLPYQFSFVYDDAVARGGVIDYFLEGDANTGEVYLLNIVLSNGPEGESKGPTIVPVQWFKGDDRLGYAALSYLLLPGNDGVERLFSRCEVSGDGGATWYAPPVGREENYEDLLRGDGYSRDDFYTFYGGVNGSWYARQLIDEGMLAAGDPIVLRVTLYNEDGSVLRNQSPILIDVPMSADIPWE